MHVHFREPGQEHKETIETGARAAAFGGFTAVACMPNTEPPIATRDVVEFVRKRAEGLPVDVYPIGAVSKGRKGEELAEMGDMAAGGAVAFSDDGAPGAARRPHAPRARVRPDARPPDPGPRGGPHAEPARPHARGRRRHAARAARHPGARRGGHDRARRAAGRVHRRPVHVCHISTRHRRRHRPPGEGAGRPDHRRGLPAPLGAHRRGRRGQRATTRTRRCTRRSARPRTHRRSRTGLADGTIDVIATDHAPHAAFEKEVEFIEAPFGILGLETCWGLTVRDLIAARRAAVEQAMYKLAVAPREILGLAVPTFEEGAEATLTVFDATTEWTFETRHIQSKRTTRRSSAHRWWGARGPSSTTACSSRPRRERVPGQRVGRLGRARRERRVRDRLGGRAAADRRVHPPRAERGRPRRHGRQRHGLSLATRVLPVGTAYAVWTGIGALGAVAYGILVLGEPRTAGRLLCLGLILAGVAGLRLLSPAGH